MRGFAFPLLLVLIVTATIYPALSSYTTGLTIFNTGTIVIMNVFAQSGSAYDIQAAVDQIVLAGGIGNVHIPAGTYNFVEPGESLISVNIPAGINIFGAPTERTNEFPVPTFGMNRNDQVVVWETVLVLPSHDNAPTPPGPETILIWFEVQGDGDYDKQSRISDIQFVGFRDVDPSSTQQTLAIKIEGVIGFRVDHCSFKNLGGGGITASGGGLNDVVSGVIDHNRLENPSGGIIGPWINRTLTYGITVGRDYLSEWEPDISDVIGQYNNYTVFIEDNYLSKWRHSITANHGGHYVSRYNTFDNDFGYGSVDVHIGNNPTEVGTRAVEVYNNEFVNRDPTYVGTSSVMFWDGGGGTFFNNSIDSSYSRVIDFDTRIDRLNYTWPKDIWIWDNDEHTSQGLVHIESGSTDLIREDIEYFLYEPHTFQYSSYPYPHPLTLGTFP